MANYRKPTDRREAAFSPSFYIRRVTCALARGVRVGLGIILALFILFEEWGWRPLANALGRLAAWRPWARIETAIARLPPYAALLVFVLPSTLLLPLKFLAVLLVARGQLLLAAILFTSAKVAATALVARLFVLTQPALMQIGWLAWVYDTVVPWKDALLERVRVSTVWRMGQLAKERARRTVLVQWRAWRPLVVELRRTVRAVAKSVAERFRTTLGGNGPRT